MPKPGYTHISVIVDRSGSMSNCVQEVLDGFNSFLYRQKNLPDDCTMSVITFSTENHYLYDRVPIKKVKAMTKSQYYPSGGTALYDAICEEVQRLCDAFSKLPHQDYPERVICVVLTDGEECSSTDYSLEDVKNTIQTMENDYDWDFLFIAANQNAQKKGATMGFKPGKSLSYAANSEGTTKAFDSATRAIEAYRTNGAPHDDEFFTDTERGEQKILGAVVH